eukprot:Gregarina_sp_Pseudo_9__1970@NODE_2361_length_1025_cov_31_935091_g2174_i0_p2_GENE_NODE_2361_length_1025_cov_31_935091_g2174_i0NODE_2361_length_1025_cov_31_935091_g2174_i0_p2_ORF_typecomplete_len155_score24_13_NODE_2361_length_1025_cov_31_935091_g2174_i0436900
MSQGWLNLTLSSFHVQLHLDSENLPATCRGAHPFRVGLGGDPIACALQTSDFEAEIPVELDDHDTLHVNVSHLISALIDQLRTISIKPKDRTCVMPVVAATEEGTGTFRRQGTATQTGNRDAAAPKLLQLPLVTLLPFIGRLLRTVHSYLNLSV